MMRMIAAIRSVRPDFTFLTGWDASLAAMLMAGADGGTNATSGVVPELTGAIYRSVREGNGAEAMRLQYQLLPIFDALIGMGEFPEGFRAVREPEDGIWDLGGCRRRNVNDTKTKPGKRRSIRWCKRSWTRGSAYSASDHTRGSSSYHSTWITFGLQHTGQSSTYC